MFEFSFSELLMIMVVALVVIGPERLPKVARTLGLLWGRAQRYVNGVKADIERDMAIAELKEMKAKIQAEAEAAQQTVKQIDRGLEEQARKINSAVARPVQEMKQQLQPPPQPNKTDETVPKSPQS